MEVLLGQQDPADVSVDQRTSSELVKLIRKLRWMGLEREAEKVENQLTLRKAQADSVIAASFPELRKRPYSSSRTVSRSPTRSPIRVESHGSWLMELGTVISWSSRRSSRATSAVTTLVRLAGAYRP